MLCKIDMTQLYKCQHGTHKRGTSYYQQLISMEKQLFRAEPSHHAGTT